MNEYLAQVRTTLWPGESYNERLLFVRAKSKQYVKYKLHKYIHENYENVDRSDEDQHEFHIADMTITLEDIRNLEESWLIRSEADDVIERV